MKTLTRVAVALCAATSALTLQVGPVSAAPPPPPAPLAAGQRCTASLYDEPQMTASGEWFNPSTLTAAHKTLPLNSWARVTNTANGRSVDVRITDRDPCISGRCTDLSTASFAVIASPSQGLIKVVVQPLW